MWILRLFLFLSNLGLTIDWASAPQKAVKEKQQSSQFYILRFARRKNNCQNANNVKINTQPIRIYLGTFNSAKQSSAQTAKFAAQILFLFLFESK